MIFRIILRILVSYRREWAVISCVSHKSVCGKIAVNSISTQEINELRGLTKVRNKTYKWEGIADKIFGNVASFSRKWGLVRMHVQPIVTEINEKPKKGEQYNGV